MYRKPLPIKIVALLIAGLMLPLLQMRAIADMGDYRLGPGDQVAIRVTDFDKLALDGDNAPRVDFSGDLDLPVIGVLHAEGMTLNQLKVAITAKLNNIMRDPKVSLSVIQYRSHPISVLGSVRQPGIVQIAQPKRLLEVLSMAGGLDQEAGDTIKITRAKSAGPLPLQNVKQDPATGYEVGTVDVHNLVSAADPDLNIEMKEGDVVAVSKAEMIFVMGAVKRAGGFTLGNHPNMSVLQALSLAEGFDKAAAPKNARVLRQEKPGEQRAEILLDLKPILAGHAPDVPLRPNDILFVPVSGLKLASIRTAEAAVQIGTGFAIFH